MTPGAKIFPTMQSVNLASGLGCQNARGRLIGCVLVFAFALLFLGGCLSPASAPPRDAVARLKHVRIVAMEPVPMPAPYPSPNPPPQIALTMTWVPTVVLANEARTLLAVRGLEPRIAPDVKEYPGVKDRQNPFWSYAEWGPPVQAWYNDDGPVAGYRDRASDKSSVVLEIGASHAISSGGLLIEVLVKVIEPSTGRVIGRSRAVKAGWTKPKVPPLDEAFANDALLFKGVYSTAGRELLQECFDSLGLVR